MGRTATLNGSLVLRPLIDAPVRVHPETRTARVPAGKTRGDILQISAFVAEVVPAVREALARKT